MGNLVDEHCEEKPKGTPPLSEQEAGALAAEVPGWKVDGNARLTREFTFPNFRDAFGFAAKAALVAEREWHHPEIELGWGRCAFELTTHSVGGLSRNDFIMAAKLERLASPD
jgi:4a-hydroxytetrahydrobiopterin dehydratase